MKKFLKFGLSFLCLAPVLLSIYSCGNSRVENDYYYDVNDKTSIKSINSSSSDTGYKKIIENFWKDLVIYDTNIEINSDILNSDIKIDLRIFEHLSLIYVSITVDFFTGLIDKWAKQFSSVGIEDFKGNIDYFFPDSFNGFSSSSSSIAWDFYLPFQKSVNFGKAQIKETPVFNMNNDVSKCIFPNSIEKIIPNHYLGTLGYGYISYDFWANLKTIIITTNITIDNLGYLNEDGNVQNVSIFKFPAGSFTNNLQKIENDYVIKGDYTYYAYKTSKNESVALYTDDDVKLINERLKSGMYIEISKTFENNDDALRFIFGWDLLDEEFNLLKSWITYI